MIQLQVYLTYSKNIEQSYDKYQEANIKKAERENSFYKKMAIKDVEASVLTHTYGHTSSHM